MPVIPQDRTRPSYWLWLVERFSGALCPSPDLLRSTPSGPMTPTLERRTLFLLVIPSLPTSPTLPIPFSELLLSADVFPFFFSRSSDFLLTYTTSTLPFSLPFVLLFKCPAEEDARLCADGRLVSRPISLTSILEPCIFRRRVSRSPGRPRPLRKAIAGAGMI